MHTAETSTNTNTNKEEYSNESIDIGQLIFMGAAIVLNAGILIAFFKQEIVQMLIKETKGTWTDMSTTGFYVTTMIFACLTILLIIYVKDHFAYAQDARDKEKAELIADLNKRQTYTRTAKKTY